MPTSGRYPNNRRVQAPLRRQLRTRGTPAEAALWRHLQRRRAGGLKWRRQFGVGPYILDFYCPAARLAVELDGAVHADPARQRYDAERTQHLEREGIAVCRFENRQVFEQPDAVVAPITEAAAQRAR